MPRSLHLNHSLPLLSLSLQGQNGRHACENSELKLANPKGPCHLSKLALGCIHVPMRAILNHVACPGFKVKFGNVCMSQHVNAFGVRINMRGYFVLGELIYRASHEE